MLTLKNCIASFLRMLIRWLEALTPEDWIDVALKNRDRLDFNYISAVSHSDRVEVWLDGRHLGTYIWLDGEDAYKSSDLGRLHACFDEWCEARNAAAA